MSYIKPVAEIERFCMIESISSCDYWSCLVNSNQHEYTGGLTKYSSLSDLLDALKSGDYGYVIYTYNDATYYIWTSSYESAESTNQSYAQLLESILGITNDGSGQMSGAWANYMKAGQVHFTTNVTESSVYNS